MSCNIIMPIHQAAKDYALHLFNVLAPGALILMQAFIGCWVVSVIIKLSCGKMSIDEAVSPVLSYTLALIFLRSQSLYWDYIYTPLTSSCAQLLSLIIPTVNNTAQVRSMPDLLLTVENGIRQVLSLGEQLGSSGGWANIVPILLGFLLSLPFLILWAIFVVYTIEYILKLLVVSAFAPLLIVASAFRRSRGYAYAAFRLVLQGIFTVSISIVAMGVTLLAIRNAVNIFHLGNKNATLINEFSSISTSFGALIMLGIVSIVFQLKAPIISSNIMGSSDGAGVAGAASAGMGSLMAWSGKKFGKGAFSSAALFKNGVSAISERSQAAFERIRTKLFD